MPAPFSFFVFCLAEASAAAIALFGSEWGSVTAYQHLIRVELGIFDPEKHQAVGRRRVSGVLTVRAFESVFDELRLFKAHADTQHGTDHDAHHII